MTASRGRPMAASMAVTQVPTLAPKISAMPASSEMNPWLASTMTMPVVAEELCTTAVKAAPTRMPSNGLRSSLMASMKGA